MDSTHSRLILILLGAPGSGKGTQAEKISQEFELLHISSGDLFREHIGEKTPIGQKAIVFIQSGQLVPDEIVLGMIFDRISRPDCAGGFLLDGVPRTVNQAHQIAKEQRDGDKLLVICLEVPDEEIIKRAAGRMICRSCGTIYNTRIAAPKHEGRCDRCGGEVYRRSDDEPEMVQKRLKVYHEQTEPLKQFYADRGILAVFNGNQPRDALFEELKEYLSHHR